MRSSTLCCRSLLLVATAFVCANAQSRELLVSIGAGAQPGSEQFNRTASVDFSFYTFERSPRQHIQIGVAYTRLTTDAATNEDLYALSVYPQLTFYPADGSKADLRAPKWAEPYFFVRALGASYLSGDTLGRRSQERFSFLAQVGAGILIDRGGKNEINLAVSWKHFSNANLSEDNDGIDVPFVISCGVRF